MARVVVFDTSVLCVWLDVAGKETCGPDSDRWDRNRVDGLIADETARQSTFVLPLATIIETGNHIAQAPARRFDTAKHLMDRLRMALNEQEPWAAFSQQADLWGYMGMQDLVEKWPDLASSGLSLGDATIMRVAEYYASTGAEVLIATGDRGLAAYQPSTPPKIPRRRK